MYDGTAAMDSPVIKDDWIAIKEFPLLSGKTIQSLEAGSSVLEKPNGTHSGDDLKDRSSSLGISGQGRLEVKWIEDLNLIQVTYLSTSESIPLDCDDKHMGYDVQCQSSKYIAELTVEKISSIHEQICLLCESLNGHLPDLPVVPKGQ